MADNIYPCCFCDLEFTVDQLMKHQMECSTNQLSYECFTCKKKVSDLLNYECEYEFQKTCFFCKTAVNNEDYDEHSVICFQYYKDQQNKYFDQIVQDEKKNLNYLNLSVNHILAGAKNCNEIIIKLIADSKETMFKQKEDKQEVKKLKEENTKLQQTLEEMNEEITELKNVVYENIAALANQEEIQNLNKEIIKLNQVVEKNATEFLALKKTTQQPQVMQHLLKDKHIIKLDQMNLRLLSDEAYYSEAVYSPEGYYYRIKIYTHSTNEKNVAIFFQFIRGELDDTLKWPFSKKIIFTLRNNEKFFAHTITPENYIQSLNASSFDKPTEEFNVAVGFPNFISHQELNQFIINNNLYLTITIQ
ncbi:TNF receptor-associated factor 5-like [Hydra vulgaris]|uniref:TNF receptor-associated factor 5-like n=1 Tax=Hydra vulgaris TaxID=6087 RepID=A0ABM4CAW7_HYDVU